MLWFASGLAGVVITYFRNPGRMHGMGVLPVCLSAVVAILFGAIALYSALTYKENVDP